MKHIIVVFLVLVSLSGSAQLRQLPIQHRTGNTSQANGRIQELGSITLPFWDDFSTSTGLIDTSWWMPESQVQIIPRPGNGILPPTVNVVTFDGVDANGNPYSPSDTDGPVDSLISRKIDLTQVPTGLRGSVYLSFFFQIKGLGNQPEPEDSLIVYFKKKDGNWKKVWPIAPESYPTDPMIFTEKLINVPNDTSYFYDAFQFKFQAIGRQNGWFDNWNVDYVFMDKRRSSNDNSYLDRAFTDVPTSILKGYTAMPFNEFMANANPAEYLTNSSTFIRTLENNTQPIEYTAIITDTLNNVVLDTIANFEELILFAGDIKEAVSAVPDPAKLDINADSLYLEIKYFARTGDKLMIDSIYNAGADTVYYPNVNLRVNDTVRSHVTIHNFFAYDDGTAEFGAGINQLDGRIAYEFIAQNNQFINQVEFYFPNISRDQAGSPMEVHILKDLKNEESSFLGMVAGAIQHEGINKFVSYNFNPPIYVVDTFYIGFRNLANDGLWTAIGLDKNTNTGNKIYYSVDGSWLPNTEIDGSLMIRPHFGEGIVSGIETKLNNIDVFPNPSTGKINIRGEFDNILVLDITGRPIKYNTAQNGNDLQLSFAMKNNSLIFIVLEKDGQKLMKKILLSY